MKFLLLVFLAATLNSGNVSALPAFPGAEGFGTETVGGRGGQVIAVTNLNDSGPGSFREAVMTPGPRIVVFKVAGTIELLTRIVVTEPYLTIAGQTAPGDGITITRHETSSNGPLRIMTHDVVIRYLRIHNIPTIYGTGQVDALTNGYEGATNVYNIVIDHCSFYWGTDEVFQSQEAHDFTIQWSIVAEGLSNATHPEEEHSKGVHFRGANSGNISMHHNLLAHHMSRNPSITTDGKVDMVNNVIYDAGRFWTIIKDVFGSPNVNAVNNFYKLGPSSWPRDNLDGWEFIFYPSSSSLGMEPRLFMSGNIGFSRPTLSDPEIEMVEPNSRFMLVTERFPAPEVTTQSAESAFDIVLNGAGANLPVRDAHDQRIVSDVRFGTGQIINDPSEVGGLLVNATGPVPVDTDGDGMPDAWETEKGLNPNDPSDATLDRNGDGYTNIEEYINSLVPGSNPPVEPPPPVDSTAPTVTMVSPVDGAVVAESVILSADASDAESGIASVQFKLDGALIGQALTSSPFSMNLDASAMNPGSYFVTALAIDNASNEQESASVMFTIDAEAPGNPPPAPGMLFVTTVSSGDLTNGSQCSDLYISYGDDDILAYNPATSCWSLYFDGSDVGLGSNEMTAFHIMPDGSILFSLKTNTSLPVLGDVAYNDVIRFIPSSLGSETAGVHEMYLDGSKIRLGVANEAVDSVSVLPDGRLIISTLGSFGVDGASGYGQDLIAFNAISYGTQSAGTFDLYFDGSKVGLGSENINGASFDENGNMYFTISGSMTLDGISVGPGDVMKCTLTGTGANTACTFGKVYSTVDLGLPSDVNINGIHLQQ